VEPRPLDDNVPATVPPTEFRIVIADFGAGKLIARYITRRETLTSIASTFANVNDGYHAFPAALRPPELVLGIPLSPRQADIWSLGCVVSHPSPIMLKPSTQVLRLTLSCGFRSSKLPPSVPFSVLTVSVPQMKKTTSTFKALPKFSVPCHLICSYAGVDARLL
jgi:serine/threonine protein kinase